MVFMCGGGRLRKVLQMLRSVFFWYHARLCACLCGGIIMRFVRAQSTPDDIEYMYALRNEPACVAYSKRGMLSRAQVEADYFENPSKHVCLVLVETTGSDAVVSSISVGSAASAGHVDYAAYVVYEDIAKSCGAGSFEISIAIDAAQRGRGLASAVLAEAAEYARRELHAQCLHACIFSANRASVRVFTQAGYLPIKTMVEPQEFSLSL